MIAIPVIAVTLFLAVGYHLTVPSSEQVFDQALRTGTPCTSADQCTVLVPDCPLGCYHAVHKSDLARFQTLAATLIEKEHSKGNICAYDCAAPKPLQCIAGRCAFASE